MTRRGQARGMTLVELVAALAIVGLAAAMVAGGLRPHAARSRSHAIDALQEGLDRATLLARSGGGVASRGSGESGGRIASGRSGGGGVVVVTVGREITAMQPGGTFRTQSALPRGWRVSLEGVSPEVKHAFPIGADGSAPDAVFLLEHTDGTRIRLERLGLSGQWRELERAP